MEDYYRNIAGPATVEAETLSPAEQLVSSGEIVEMSKQLTANNAEAAPGGVASDRKLGKVPSIESSISRGSARRSGCPEPSISQRQNWKPQEARAGGCCMACTVQ